MPSSGDQSPLQTGGPANLDEVARRLDEEGQQGAESAETVFAVAQATEQQWQSWMPAPTAREYEPFTETFLYTLAPDVQATRFVSGRAVSLAMSGKTFLERGGEFLFGHEHYDVRIHSLWRSDSVPGRFRSIKKLWMQQFADQPSAEVLAASPLLAKVSMLSVSGLEDDQGAARLLQSPTVRNLSRLHLCLRFQDDGAAEAVAAGQALSLRVLTIGEHDDQGGPRPGGDRACRALSGATNLSSLQNLALPSGNITAAGLEALLQSRSLAGLVSLSVSRNKMGAAAGAALRDAKSGRALQVLDLTGVDLDAEGLAQLLHSPAMEGLTELRLDENPIGDAGAEAIAASPSVRRLRVLGLGYSGLTPHGARLLAASEHLAGIQTLDLGGNELGDEGVGALVARDAWPALRVLALRHVELTDLGLEQVLKSKVFARLESLDCRGNSLTARSVQGLSQADAPLQLRNLRISEEYGGIQCSPEEVARFAASPVCRRLNVLGLCVSADDARPHAKALSQNGNLPFLVSLHWSATCEEQGYELLRERWGDRVHT